MKKPLPIILAAVVILGVAAYFLFLAPKEEPPVPTTYYSPGEYIVSNVKDSARLLKITPVLEIYGEHTEFLKANEHIIRDHIIFVVRYKTEGEIRSEDIQDSIREELVQRLNEALGVDYVTYVYFYDFVLQ